MRKKSFWLDRVGDGSHLMDWSAEHSESRFQCPRCMNWTDSSKEPSYYLIPVDICLYIAVTSTCGCSDHYPEISQHMLMPFSVFFGGLYCISWHGLVFSFVKKKKKHKKSKKALGVLFCIFAFFCTMFWWGYGGGGVGRAVVLIFSCEANKRWKGALLLCADLATTSWLDKMGFYMTQDMNEPVKDQITHNKKLITPMYVFSSL